MTSAVERLVLDVAAARERFVDTVGTPSTAEAEFQPDANEWSITQNVEHITLAEQVGINGILAGTRRSAGGPAGLDRRSHPSRPPDRGRDRVDVEGARAGSRDRRPTLGRPACVLDRRAPKLSAVTRGARRRSRARDCPPAPASCARPVLVLGFPLPYISDYHGISVVGNASLIGALLGEDHFHRGAFIADVAVYVAVAAAAGLALRTVRSRAVRAS